MYKFIFCMLFSSSTSDVHVLLLGRFQNQNSTSSTWCMPHMRPSRGRTAASWTTSSTCSPSSPTSPPSSSSCSRTQATSPRTRRRGGGGPESVICASFFLVSKVEGEDVEGGLLRAIAADVVLC